MIVANGTYYLYRHIRCDTGEPFYIGVGQKEVNNAKRHSTEYRRAYVKTRNPLWKNVTSKTKYEVEIIVESNDKLFIQNKEKEFISIYGRKEKGGLLTNLTDGGDYYPLIKRKNHKQGRNYMSYEKRVEVMSKIKRPELGTNNIELWVYSGATGVIIGHFLQIKEAALKLNIPPTCISVSIKNRKSYNGYIFSRFDFGDKCNINSFNHPKWTKKPVCKICPNTFVVLEKYEDSVSAVRQLGLTKSNLPIAIKAGIKFGGYYWKYDDGKPFEFKGKRNKIQPVVKIDPISREVIERYESIKEAALKNNHKYPSNINKGIKTGTVRAGYLWQKL